MKNGKRKLVQVYQLFNAQDIGSNFKTMEPMVKKLCLSKECTRALLMKYFVGGRDEVKEVGSIKSSHCCHNCDRDV